MIRCGIFANRSAAHVVPLPTLLSGLRVWNVEFSVVLSAGIPPLSVQSFKRWIIRNVANLWLEALELQPWNWRDHGNGFIPPYPCKASTLSERIRCCGSTYRRLFRIMSPSMKMSPGSWTEAQGPTHLAAIVIVFVPPGMASFFVVTVIV
jgi:hypothetical protein